MARPVTCNVKENQKEYMKKYFAEKKELITCECGSHIDIYSMKRHLKTKKHTQVMELINNIKELEKKIDL